MGLKRVKALTLTEVVITIFIFLIICSVIFAILASGKNAWQVAEARIALQQELRKSIDVFVKELRQAGSSAIIGVPADDNWYDVIIFRMPEDVIGGSVAWGSQIQYSLGGLNGKQLLRDQDGEQKVIANNIILFQVRRKAANPNIVEVVLRSDKTTIRGTLIEADLDISVKIRN